MKPSQLNPNRQVVIANALNEARFRMSRAEQKLFLYCLGNINNIEENIYAPIEFSMQEFGNYLELNPTRLYHDFRRLTYDLTTRAVDIGTGYKDYVQMSLISRVEYKDGRVKIDMNPKLAPYLIELKNNFTSYSLKEVLKFRSVYSIRIYQILSQYAGLKSKTYELEQLRFFLNVGKDEYKKYNDFKKKVLEVALKEINQSTVMRFAFEEIKTGRKVTSIRFVIKKFDKPKVEFIAGSIEQTEVYKNLPVPEVEVQYKDQSAVRELATQQEPEPKTPPPVHKQLINLGYSSQNSIKLINDYTPEYLEYIFEKSKIEDRQKVINKAGYFGTLIVQYREIYKEEQNTLKTEQEEAKNYQLEREQFEKEKNEAERLFAEDQPNIAREKLEEEPEYFCKLAYLYMKRMIVDTKAGFTYHPDWLKNQANQSYDVNIKLARQIHTEFMNCKDLREFRNLVKYEHEWLFKAVFNDRRELNPDSQEYYKKNFFVNKMELPFKV